MDINADNYVLTCKIKSLNESNISSLGLSNFLKLLLLDKIIICAYPNLESIQL